MAQRRRTSLIETGLPPRGSPHSRPPPTIVVDDVAASRSPLHWDWSAVETGSRPASPGRPASPRRVTALDDHIGPSVTGDGRRAAAAALALSTPELRNPTDRGRESAARVGSPVTRRLAQEDGAESTWPHTRRTHTGLNSYTAMSGVFISIAGSLTLSFRGRGGGEVYGLMRRGAGGGRGGGGGGGGKGGVAARSLIEERGSFGIPRTWYRTKVCMATVDIVMYIQMTSVVEPRPPLHPHHSPKATWSSAARRLITSVYGVNHISCL